MSDLIVLAFDDEQGAFEMREKLLRLQKEGIISLGDAAVVVRTADGEVKVKQLSNMAGEGALGGGILGLIIGTLFLVPWMGLAAGALGGALLGKRTDIGVDDKFIKEVSEKIEPGHSALFLLVYQAVEEKVMPELAQFSATLLRTNLAAEDEANLRAKLSGGGAADEVS